MRPIWNGGISFGLIFIPVRLFSAVETVTLDLDMLDERDHAHIKYKRINEETGKEVPWERIVKGYEVEKGNYVILEEEDFKNADIEKSETIEILSFVDQDEIDPVYFEKPYYLEPVGAAKKTYALLREALKDSNKVGIAEFVLRDREHLVALQADGDTLIMMQMRYASEIKSDSELNIPGRVEISKKELELAVSLIDQMSDKFDPKDYKDDYMAALKKVISAKAHHRKIKAPKHEKRSATEIPNLMEQLKRSLATT